MSKRKKVIFTLELNNSLKMISSNKSVFKNKHGSFSRWDNFYCLTGQDGTNYTLSTSKFLRSGMTIKAWFKQFREYEGKVFIHLTHVSILERELD